MTSLLMMSNIDVRCKQRGVIEIICHEGIKQVGVVETLLKSAQIQGTISQLSFCHWLDVFISSFWMMTIMKKTEKKDCSHHSFHDLLTIDLHI